MSESQVRVVRVGPLEKHPNADTLSVALVDGGYPVIVRTDEFKEGDLAAYVPVDSVVPDTEKWAFLKGHRRVRAKKLRGVFSMGLLTSLPPGVGHYDSQGFWQSRTPEEGEDVTELMGVTKYEPEMRSLITYSDNVPDPGFFPKYTDIEGMRRHGSVLAEGEDVVITEKVHGANSRVGFHEGQLWVGSHNHFKKRPGEGDPVDIWWRSTLESGLEERLRPLEGLGFYGEVFGKVQDLSYGVKGLAVRFFDAMALKTGAYLGWDAFVEVCQSAGLETVPVLHRGPWSEDLRSLAEGPTTLGGGPHVREGIVVRPTTERFERSVGRVILKLHGQGFLLRKDG